MRKYLLLLDWCGQQSGKFIHKQNVLESGDGAFR